MTTDLSTKCDCVAVEDEDQAAHQMICALWDNDLFSKGIADWNPGLGELILVHPVESLHTSNDDSIGGALGDVPEDLPPNPMEEAWTNFEDRCEEVETDLWEAFDKDLCGWPLFNYTIDGISRVFDPEYGEWNNQALKCHCDPQEEKSCVVCGVYREKGKGSYWETMWRPSIVRATDVICRCPEKSSSQWNCLKCGVKRLPVSDRECQPLAMPMIEWTDEMAKAKKPKGGTTAWGNWNKGGMTNLATYVSCRHKGRELEFPNGKKIYGSSCHAKAPEGYKPDFGIYLDSCWFSEQTCLGLALPWQDMGLPKLDRDLVDTALVLAQSLVDKGDVVEVGCVGGHGRTGTFLALVAMRNGVETPEEAITYVREHYCEKAIESDTQEWYIKAWYAEDHGLPIPEKPVKKSFAPSDNAKTYQKNGDLDSEKRCDGSLIWYCPECNADNDDDSDECYWCLAKFSNKGVRPATEWFATADPGKLAEIEARVLKPLPAKAKKRTPPKEVKGTTVKDAPALPFGTQSEDYGGWL